MNGPNERLEITQRVNASPETVFSYFVDAKKYAKWQGVAAELDPRPGGVYRVAFDRIDACGEFLEVDPFRRVVFTWGWQRRAPATDGPRTAPPPGIAEVSPGSTTVEVTLEPDGTGTLVRLSHSGLPTPDAREAHQFGWTLYLSRLAEASAGGDPGADPLPSLVASTDAPWLKR